MIVAPIMDSAIIKQEVVTVFTTTLPVMDTIDQEIEEIVDTMVRYLPPHVPTIVPSMVYAQVHPNFNVSVK